MWIRMAESDEKTRANGIAIIQKLADRMISRADQLMSSSCTASPGLVAGGRPSGRKPMSSGRVTTKRSTSGTTTISVPAE